MGGQYTGLQHCTPQHCRLCVESLAKFPEPYDDLQITAKISRHLMTEKEDFALQLTLGQQECLHELKKQLHMCI